MSAGGWVPASGYRTKAGKSKWRAIWHDDLSDYRVGRMREHETAVGRTWLCNTPESAKRKCTVLNVKALAAQINSAPGWIDDNREVVVQFLTAGT